MLTKIAKATANVTAAAAATDEFALSIGEISRQASASATLARDATNLVTTANTRMTDLSQAADEIGEIANLIQTIAQRTNLLALNASIEAARGGEAGRGFAVVASEVKELAMQTSNATSSVAEKITAKQADDWGMIWESVPDASFADHWRSRAMHLAKGPTAAYQRVKQSIRQSFDNDLEDQLALEAKLQGQCGKTRDFKEGVVAFLEKRPAQYEGR